MLLIILSLGFRHIDCTQQMQLQHVFLMKDVFYWTKVDKWLLHPSCLKMVFRLSNEYLLMCFMWIRLTKTEFNETFMLLLMKLAIVKNHHTVRCNFHRFLSWQIANILSSYAFHKDYPSKGISSPYLHTWPLTYNSLIFPIESVNVLN